MNGHRPRYTQEEWRRVIPDAYKLVFGHIRPIVRVKAGRRDHPQDLPGGLTWVDRFSDRGMPANTLGALLG